MGKRIDGGIICVVAASQWVALFFAFHRIPLTVILTLYCLFISHHRQGGGVGVGYGEETRSGCLCHHDPPSSPRPPSGSGVARRVPWQHSVFAWLQHLSSRGHQSQQVKRTYLLEAQELGEQDDPQEHNGDCRGFASSRRVDSSEETYLPSHKHCVPSKTPAPSLSSTTHYQYLCKYYVGG